jgi:hypothetical protein
MTVDVKCHEFAALWLRTGGWTSELDIKKLSELIQSVCEDFTADLTNEYEEACGKHERP